MIKKTLTLLFFISTVFTVSAQYVTIPDANFAYWLEAHYPGCVTGNQMDTTCTAITTETAVYCDDEAIADLDGIQYFDNLIVLDCRKNNLTTLPSLPMSSLGALNFRENNIVSIPNLPPNITYIDCSFNNLNDLPALPAVLETFDGSYNPWGTAVPAFPSSTLSCAMRGCGLTTIPSVPTTLQTLDIGLNLGITDISTIPPNLIKLNCDYTGISTVPPLSPILEELNCQYNGLTLGDIPSLPTTLRKLYISGNALTDLPTLPNELETLYASDNLLTTITTLPDSLNWLLLNDNASLTQIDDLPEGLQNFLAKDCALQMTGEFPSTLTNLQLDNNNLSCLNPIPNGVNFLVLSGNPFTCIPNVVPAMSVAIAALPICEYGDITNNPNWCPTGAGIEGNVYNDLNTNCNVDPTDGFLPNVTMRLFDNSQNLIQTTTTNATNGRYFFVTDVGTYTVEVDTVGKPYTADCLYPGADSSFTILAPDSILQNVDFIMNCKPGFDVGAQSVLHTGWVFPGEEHVVQIKAGDMSNWYGMNCATGVSGQVVVDITGPVEYVTELSGSLVPTITGSTLTYSISDFGTVDFENDFGFMLETDTTAVAFDEVCIHVSVTPTSGDYNNANNDLSYCYPVINSYDPNKKEVYPSKVEPGFNDYLYYTIYFQNTGSAPAFNIRLEDTLSSLLDYSTFEVIGFSHDNTVNLTDNRLIVYYPDIMLPDSTSDEANSKGYIQFRIKPIDNLPAGTEVENSAHIFFDFNPAIVTNTATTLYFIDLSVNDFFKNPEIVIYPNPTNGIFTITSEVITGDETIVIYDEVGRIVPFEKVSSLTGSAQMNINSEFSGVLFVTIKSHNQVYQTKIVRH